jgi:hypothetical protein
MAWKRSSVRSRPGPPNLFKHLEDLLSSPLAANIKTFVPEGFGLMFSPCSEDSFPSLVVGDGRYLYYLRYGPESAVMRIRISDRQVEEVARLKGIRQAGRLAGLEFGMTPDGAPMVLKDVGTQEIYSLDWYEP